MGGPGSLCPDLPTVAVRENAIRPQVIGLETPPIWSISSTAAKRTIRFRHTQVRKRGGRLRVAGAAAQDPPCNLADTVPAPRHARSPPNPTLGATKKQATVTSPRFPSPPSLRHPS